MKTQKARTHMNSISFIQIDLMRYPAEVYEKLQGALLEASGRLSSAYGLRQAAYRLMDIADSNETCNLRYSKKLGRIILNKN